MMLVIVMLAAGIVVPRLSSTLGSNDVTMEARKVKAKIIYAQQSAIASQRRFRVHFDPAGEKFHIKYDPGNNNVFTVIETVILENGVNLVSTTFAGPHILDFDYLGAPNQGGQVNLMGGGTNVSIEVAPATGKVEIL